MVSPSDQLPATQPPLPSVGVSQYTNVPSVPKLLEIITALRTALVNAKKEIGILQDALKSERAQYATTTAQQNEELARLRQQQSSDQARGKHVELLTRELGQLKTQLEQQFQTIQAKEKELNASKEEITRLQGAAETKKQDDTSQMEIEQLRARCDFLSAQHSAKVSYAAVEPPWPLFETQPTPVMTRDEATFTEILASTRFTQTETESDAQQGATMSSERGSAAMLEKDRKIMELEAAVKAEVGAATAETQRVREQLKSAELEKNRAKIELGKYKQALEVAETRNTELSRQIEGLHQEMQAKIRETFEKDLLYRQKMAEASQMATDLDSLRNTLATVTQESAQRSEYNKQMTAGCNKLLQAVMAVAREAEVDYVQ